MEAMASGIPVVATRVGGVGELVEDGVNGYLVPAGAPGALADRIESLLDDPALRIRFGRAGRAKVAREFNIKCEAARLRDLHQWAVEAKPHTPWHGDDDREVLQG
jgi:glycosyltransferase involved in cell wall biosynthesis